MYGSEVPRVGRGQEDERGWLGACFTAPAAAEGGGLMYSTVVRACVEGALVEVWCSFLTILALGWGSGKDCTAALG